MKEGILNIHGEGNNLIILKGLLRMRLSNKFEAVTVTVTATGFWVMNK